ncbi:MAG: hypothetical protein LC105_10600 [Chitinophagales bacterium]|nr:hypothetical protein [Chitinophagales bacterium]MCZ2394298.1 hypothetical protein [Chitinophagales bacterium]
MLKDINFDNHDIFKLAICPSYDGLDTIYDVILLNETDEKIEQVMVSCSGHGEVLGQEKNTAIMRVMVGDLPAFSFVGIESIIGETVDLRNDFFICGFYEGRLKDKLIRIYIRDLLENDLKEIPLIDRKGWLV